MLTLTEVDSVSGEEGNFEINLIQHPRYVDMDKCIACGVCAEKCPKKVANEYDAGLNKRKAAYVQYAQAVPLKYALDAKQCIYLIRGKCKACEKFCPADAIFFDDQEKKISLKVGAVVLASGSKTFDPLTYDTYGYLKSDNVVTSLEFERILSASGPYGGHLVRPSDKSEPQKIAWLQCVGSRDTHIGARGYCSGVCCTYAVKEAILAKEHSKNGLDAAIFYIDIRTFGKDFERYYNKARQELGVRFIKSRITHVDPGDENGRHLIRYVDGAGKSVAEEFDIVVLSVGLGINDQTIALAEKLNVELNHYHFADTGSFDPVQSSRPGIYVCGAFQGPKDIPTSVIDASAAAGKVGSKLSDARWTLTKTKELPEQIDVKGEPPRIGVFVCCCGTNIAGFVDVPAVVEFAQTLPNVAYAEQNLFSCSQDTQGQISQVIKAHRLNRVVVSACTPKTHEPLFQETLINGGLNKYLFEMANIRNQCSWVHKDDMATATEKAKDLVRMAVAKVALYEPLEEPVTKINQAALVIGGGVAGMTAARTLSQQGYKTHLVEKHGELGGQARHINETWKNEPVGPFLQASISNVQSDKNIEVHLNASVENVEGFVGNFKTTIRNGAESTVIEHGVTLIASGAAEFKPDELLYNRDSRVLTGLELKQQLKDNSSFHACRTAVFIQCVGSRNAERPWCSKVCCTQSIKSALDLRSINPDMHIYVLYRDIRSYGLREDLYREARDRGIKFIRYNNDHGIAVKAADGGLRINFSDRVLRRAMVIQSDLLILASAVVPQKNNPLAQLYKVPQNADGFFAEAHVKLRPNDFATDGVFVCGLAHAPKPIDESIAQAQAAASRAVTILSALEISVSGTVALVDPSTCSQCGVCVAVCPYSAPKFNENSAKAEIQSTLCKGCGLCVASCRSGALHLKGFDTSQIMAMLTSCVWEEAPFETTFS
ncbi:heterodisulfide reductase, subunit A/methylviologen reducing hydrogenase, subunit delta [Olavius sp. associated proteobacterium Delta 1]|nr:heterodisulfide reductase, subunit A/methylviologen reducing hydrogenase, subunit delta [Olavius sp. associated proteobacterium Delta 1]